MILNIYALKDEFNGFTTGIPFPNNEIAKRYLKEQKAENVTVKNSPEDFSVWHLGTFDTDTGVYDTKEPKLLERG